ncbi:Enoyl-(Acyl carrier protein) reductase [Ceratobasidium sp. AG-Ba]|nr:Enoyl-(Acyl carrier protein) reductase [Ceratobasidium sp. AG-Ba]
MSYTLTVLKDKKILIIGGSSGIGRAVAAASLAYGASVVIASSRQPKVNAAVELLKKDIQGEAGANVSGQVVDIKDFKSLTEFLTSEAPFDHLVITAGDLAGGFPKPPNLARTLNSWIDLWSMCTEDSVSKRRTKFESQYALLAFHECGNNLIHPGGSIVGTIAAAESRPMPGVAFFSGVLGAIATATRGLALDLKPLRINAISPGIVDTEIFSSFPPEVRTHLMDSTLQKLPVGHIGTAEELAEAYIFAMKASTLYNTSHKTYNLIIFIDQCQFLTGQIITVDGGGNLA